MCLFNCDFSKSNRKCNLLQQVVKFTLGEKNHALPPTPNKTSSGILQFIIFLSNVPLTPGKTWTLILSPSVG